MSSFISLVYKEYRHSYTSKLYGVLSILVGVDYLFSVYSITPYKLLLTIGSDYLSVLNNITRCFPLTPFAIKLHQIIREIRLLMDKQKIKLISKKIKVHQDNRKAFSRLNRLEKLNILWNRRAKRLIRRESRKFIEFPFILSSPYLTSQDKEVVLNNPRSLREQAELSRVSKYLVEKFHLPNIAIAIDQYSHSLTLEKLPPMIQIQCNKSQLNFCATSHSLVQRKLLGSTIYRYCGVINQVNSFHSFYYVNEHITKVKHQLFDHLFDTIFCFDILEELKEVIFQTLIDNRDFSPPTFFIGLYSLLQSFGIKNLWYRVTLVALLDQSL